jgi:hypothetical protein
VAIHRRCFVDADASLLRLPGVRTTDDSLFVICPAGVHRQCRRPVSNFSPLIPIVKTISGHQQSRWMTAVSTPFLSQPPPRKNDCVCWRRPESSSRSSNEHRLPSYRWLMDLLRAVTPSHFAPVPPRVKSTVQCANSWTRRPQVGLAPRRPGVYVVKAIVPGGLSGDAVPVVVTAVESVAGDDGSAVGDLKASRFRNHSHRLHRPGRRGTERN